MRTRKTIYQVETAELGPDQWREPRADFAWAMADFETGPNQSPFSIIKIFDIDNGNMSVTNDAERVLENIFGHVYRRNPTPGEIVILYRDSMDQWDRMHVVRHPARGAEARFSVEFTPGPRTVEELARWGIQGDDWTLPLPYGGPLELRRKVDELVDFEPFTKVRRRRTDHAAE